MTRERRSIKCIAWIREKRESNFYLVMKKFEKQLLFGVVNSKQMKLVVGIDGYLKKFSSVMLENAQIEICHWRVHGENSCVLCFQLGNKAPNSFQRDGKMKNK